MSYGLAENPITLVMEAFSDMLGDMYSEEHKNTIKDTLSNQLGIKIYKLIKNNI